MIIFETITRNITFQSWNTISHLTLSKHIMDIKLNKIPNNLKFFTFYKLQCPIYNCCLPAKIENVLQLVTASVTGFHTEEPKFMHWKLFYQRQ